MVGWRKTRMCVCIVDKVRDTAHCTVMHAVLKVHKVGGIAGRGGRSIHRWLHWCECNYRDYAVSVSISQCCFSHSLPSSLLYSLLSCVCVRVCVYYLVCLSYLSYTRSCILC